MLNAVSDYRDEILKGFSISKKMKDSYQTLGDRSAYVIKLFKKIKNNSTEVSKFVEAMRNLLLEGDKDFIAFSVDLLTDGIEFGNLL
jgi:hypothetical protein